MAKYTISRIEPMPLARWLAMIGMVSVPIITRSITNYLTPGFDIDFTLFFILTLFSMIVGAVAGFIVGYAFALLYNVSGAKTGFKIDLIEEKQK